MYANTCWGFLSLAVGFGLAVIGLPTEYVWLKPYFIYGALVCGAVSILLFSWPLFRRIFGPAKTGNIELAIQKVTFEEEPHEDVGDVYFVVRNGGELPTTLHNWSVSVNRPGGVDIPHLPAHFPPPFPRIVLRVEVPPERADDFENDPMPVGARREARYKFLHNGINARETLGIKGTKFTLSCEDGRQMKHRAVYVMP
jgi:hypothetical protein